MEKNIFKRLEEKLDIQKYDQGISALELAQLPPNLRKIMRLILREIEMTYPAICSAADALPPSEQLERRQLDEALETLTLQGWLIRRGEGDHINYLVNLRRKRGSSLEDSFWGKLDKRLKENKTNQA